MAATIAMNERSVLRGRRCELIVETDNS